MKVTHPSSSTNLDLTRQKTPHPYIQRSRNKKRGKHRQTDRQIDRQQYLEEKLVQTTLRSEASRREVQAENPPGAKLLDTYLLSASLVRTVFRIRHDDAYLHRR